MYVCIYMYKCTYTCTLTGIISEALQTKSLAVLGDAYKGKIILFQNAEELAQALLNASKAEPSDWGGYSAPSVSALFEIDPVSGSGTVTIGYNKDVMKSARAVMSEILNATARMGNAEQFGDGLGCSYLFWRSPLYSNGISGYLYVYE